MVASPTPTHRVSRAVAGMRAATNDLNDALLWSMTAAETEATLIELTRLRAQVEALSLRVLAHADASGVATGTGASSTAHWYARTTRLTRTQARREIHLATTLDAHPATADAWAAGDLHPDQARVVINAVTQLPDDLDDDVLDGAERTLVEEAQRFDADRLRALGRHLVEVAAPDVAEDHTARLLEREERAAAADQRLVMHDDGHGRVHGRFTLDALHGAVLRKALFALAAPKHLAATRGPTLERAPGPERLGVAFAEFVARYPTDQLPGAGGLSATVVVTMTLADLRGDRERPASLLDTGTELSAATARRLACEAGLVPAVLAHDSTTVLDLGRTARLFSPRQRLALAIRDRGCTADGCDWPPGMTHAHHDTPWSEGGRTDLANARLLCPFHHARVHDRRYASTRLPGGKITFTRRC